MGTHGVIDRILRYVFLQIGRSHPPLRRHLDTPSQECCFFSRNRWRGSHASAAMIRGLMRDRIYFHIVARPRKWTVARTIGQSACVARIPAMVTRSFIVTT